MADLNDAPSMGPPLLPELKVTPFSYVNLPLSLVTEANAMIIAANRAKQIFNIKSPPPWLVCSILHVPYYPPIVSDL